ncbi:ABC transporter ATP-binding protein [Acetobacteraceae bacterium KSS8]|uniref:ABC transporter ATP-binding protein n=1 Tax=Endosaccharibacter trunci TaxID=2812733 RepID=A0ABT1WCV8_9PROT|nr:ABC transporter ATP-binding protein [Acetobacteraceae bacterium KSS8]
MPTPMPSTSPPPFRLSVEALRVRGARQAVVSASFSIAPGRTLALLGDAADGTSLLLDAIAGHAPIDHGAILRDGRPIGALPPRDRGIGLVSPRDPLFTHLDVAGNIGFPLRVRGLPSSERDRRIADGLALLGLDAVAHVCPADLSPADAVRAALARALAADPVLLLLDAPLQLLRPREREQLRRSLKRLVGARGLTMLLATEDRDEALSMGDEVGVLDRGTLHQVDSGAALLERPCDAVVAARIGDANLLPGRILENDGETARVRLPTGHVMEAEPFGALPENAACTLAVRPDRIATAFLNRRGSEMEAAEDALPGTLQDVLHLGDHLRLRFRLADGMELLVRRPPAAILAELRPGRVAMLAWQPHQARVFPVSDEQPARDAAQGYRAALLF